MPKHKPLPQLEGMAKELMYNPGSGIFTNLVHRKNSSPAGAVSGCKAQHGYRLIRYKGSLYLAHRLAWLFSTGEDPAQLEVDHIDGDPANNAISNLRLATHRQNLFNRKKPSSNTSGFTGVYRHRGRWVAYARVDGRRKDLGTFSVIEDAAKARNDFVKANRGDFARIGVSA